MEKLVSPLGDPARHRSLAELEAGARKLSPAPRDSGTVRLIVRRLPDGSREALDRVRLSIAEGVPGDAWSRRQPVKPEAQLAVMRFDVAQLIADGQHPALFGDNLLVDLDLSAANLPPGTRLQVGDARVEVTPKPHNGCRKLAERFGHDALRWVADPGARAENRRGIYWRVVTEGEVAVGAAIEVLR